MNRRSFIEKSMAASACALTGANSVAASESKTKNGYKIKVLKCTHHQDLYQKLRNSNGRPCPIFQEGQEFIIHSQYQKPQGFCDWAWADIRPFIQAVWHGREDAVVTCCTDGFRPVIFQLSRT